MSDFIRKPAPLKNAGLGPKAQKMQALLEKAAAAEAAKTAGTKPGPGSAATALKAKNSFAGKKTAFQRKAT